MQLEGISSIIIPHSFTPPTEIFYIAQRIELLYLFLFLFIKYVLCEKTFLRSKEARSELS